MKTENYYDKMREIEAETTPLPKEEFDIPTKVIPIDPDAQDEPVDRVYVEAEVEMLKKGVPIIDVERPVIPDVKTDPTPYKKVEVNRKEKRSDKKCHKDDTTLKEDREMKAYVEKLKIPKKKGIFTILQKKIYDLSCKICRFALNMQRKKYSKAVRNYDDKILPKNIRTMPLESADEKSAESLGRARAFKREDDSSSNTIQMVRNKKTGVVVATPMISTYKEDLEEKGKDIKDYEVVESQIKD